jgi:hypothetical protein
MPPHADAEANRKVFARKALDKGVNKISMAAITVSQRVLGDSFVNVPDR